MKELEELLAQVTEMLNVAVEDERNKIVTSQSASKAHQQANDLAKKVGKSGH